MWLEGRLSVLIIAKFVEKVLHRVGEALVRWVVVELFGEEFGLVDDAVRVVPVTVTEKELSTVVQLVPFLRRAIGHDVALLLEALANISVHVLEP